MDANNQPTDHLWKELEIRKVFILLFLLALGGGVSL